MLPDILEAIGISSFSCCTELEELYIPDGVEYIRYLYFQACINLKKIHFHNNIYTYQDLKAYNIIYWKKIKDTESL